MVDAAESVQLGVDSGCTLAEVGMFQKASKQGHYHGWFHAAKFERYDIISVPVLVLYCQENRGNFS